MACDVRLGPRLFRLLVEIFEILDEVDTVELAMLIDHVVAFQLLDLARLLQRFELGNLQLQLTVVQVLRVPVRDFVELKEMPKFHCLIDACDWQDNLLLYS